MKHVSRVLFGFSIVAVLALFTACPQAADAKKETGSSLKNELNLTAKKALAALNDMSGVAIDAEKGNLIIEETAGETITIPQSQKDGYTLKEVKIPAKKSVSSKVDGGNIVLTVKDAPKGEEVIDVVLVITKGTGKDVKTSEVAVKLVNKKKAAGGNLTALSIKNISKITVANVPVTASQGAYSVQVAKELAQIEKGDVTIGAGALDGLKAEHASNFASLFEVTIKKSGAEIGIDLTTDAKKTYTFTAVTITVTKASAGGNLTALSIKNISKITVANVPVTASQGAYSVQVAKELAQIEKGDVTIGAGALDGLKAEHASNFASLFEVTIKKSGAEIGIDLTTDAKKTYTFTAVTITVTKS
ncbi:MAG: hypothetical protein ACTTH7_04065 [Treponema sp.]